MRRATGPEAGRFVRALSRRPLVRRIRHLAVAPRTADGMMLGLAAVVGLATGLLAVVLIRFVALVQRLAFGTDPGPLTVVAATTLGGLAVGLLITYVLPEVKGGGVTQVMEAIAVRGGRMRGLVVPGKLLASGVSLGTGSSGGREGPIVQVGGAVGSLLGRVFALGEEQKRVLIAAGAAAGISASFNAPIGGMLFAVEVIIGGFRLRYLQVIVISSVAASVTAREIVGEALIYNPPSYELGAPAELVLFAMVGLGAVLVGLALARGEHLAVRLAEGTAIWPPLRTAAGGLAVGLLALGLPEVLGTGDDLPRIAGAVHEPIAAMLSGEFAPEYGLAGLGAAGLLVALLLAKLLATCLSIGTGAAVGSFGPAIFLGAALGGAIGHAATIVVPDAAIRPGALALVGMAAVLGASSRAPLTGILIVFELTGSYGLVLPLMLATGIATLVADRIDGRSVYTLPLHERGILYAEPEDVDVLQTVRVGEVMTRNPRRLDVGAPLEELERALAETGQHGFPVVRGTGDAQRLVGVVATADLERALAGAGGHGGTPSTLDGLSVGDICTRTPVTVTPVDPVFRAVRRMASLDVGRLPVVSEEDHGRLVGWIRRADIVRAYQRALHRSLGTQQRQAGSRLRELSGTQFVEATVTKEAPACGRAVRDIDWPPRTLLTSVRRSGELVTPNGSTELQAGDEVLALVDTDHVHALRTLITSRP